MRIRVAGLVVLLALLSVSKAEGQVPWDSPLLVGPGSPGGFSILLVDPGPGIGVMGQWRNRSGRTGFRVGVGEDAGPGDDLAVFGGVDFSGRLFTHNQNFPLDLVWVAGVGAGFGDDVLISVPFGVSMGRVFPSEEVRFHPYLAPRLVVDAFFGDGDRDDLDLGFALDIGIDFSFSGNWAFRVGGCLGDREGLAVGVAFPFG